MSSVPKAQALPERPPLTERDATERLGVEDMAALHAEQLLSAAMLDQQRAASKAPPSVAGVCSNCGAQCLPQVIYCDADCRADHETRLQTLRRQGVAR